MKMTNALESENGFAKVIKSYLIHENVMEAIITIY